MELTFAPRGILQIEDAVLIYKNFEGRGDKFNREGDRNFGLRIFSEELADQLEADGWNVKRKEPREPGDDPFMYIPVKVKFNERGPVIWCVSGRNKRRLSEKTVGRIDNMDILSVDLDIRPYDWEVNDKTGRTAYLHAMCVTQNIDRFSARFAEDEFPEE